MKIEAVVFDMEGVLVESEVYWFHSRQGFAEDRGKAWTMDDQKHAMGRNTTEWAAVMKERLGVEDSIDAIVREMLTRVLRRYSEAPPLRDGSRAAVVRMKERYKVALASGSPTPVIQHVVRLMDLGGVFDAIVYGDDILNGKPNPDIYLEAAKQLGVLPRQCVGVEDSANGVRALHAANMRVVAAPSPEFPLPDDVLKLTDHVIGHMDEFTTEMVDALKG